MKSNLSSSRRAQPIRQTRTNPPRSSLAGSRQFGAREPLSGADGPPSPEQAIDIFPAITHFADAITALPKELVRHFTLLKEVDAKIFAPEEDLGKYISSALNAPPPERQPLGGSGNSLVQPSNSVSAPESTNGSIANGQTISLAPIPDTHDASANAPWDDANLERRKLFQHCAYTMSNMLLSLDEKNHVISTATEALNKQLARIDDCFPHVENEISEEARCGSLTHWAYPENRTHKTSSGGGSRRDIAAVQNLSAAAQRLVDEAAARSDERKQALLAKKSNKNHVESDFDDHHDARQREKKVHGNSKVRKAGETAAIGLGITNGTIANGNTAKRRKVEKGQNGGTGMERALSGMLGTNGSVTKKAASPRETPPIDGTKKRQRAPNATNGHSRKRNNTVTSIAMSPSLASSPIRSTFPDAKLGGRAPSPVANGSKPASSRGRQNSTQTMVENSKQRPSSATSNKQTAIIPGSSEISASSGGAGQINSDAKAVVKDSGVTSKGEQSSEDARQSETDLIGSSLVGTRKETALKREETESNGEPMQDIRSTTITMTKSGRASKPSTPHISQFNEPTRSRSARTALEAASNNKRSHKKGAGAAAQQLLAARSREDDDTSSVPGDDDDDEEINPDEPRYCYCNGVSYGEMVGCDGETCEKEWFHLECAGLKVAPKEKVKWYCEDCRLKLGLKRSNNR